MKTTIGLLFAAALVTTSAAPAEAQDLKLSMRDGRVTLIADNVPVSRILAEWARVGQTTILNGDKLTGPPVTLHFENHPEREVLEILLRSASGYIVAPRQVAMADAAVFDRVLIMPTSRPPAVSASAPPQFNRPPAPPVPIQPDIDDDPVDQPVMPPQGMPAGMQNQPPNMPPNVPMTQPGMPGQQQVPMTQPRPGMPTPVPGGPGGPGGMQPNPYVPQPPQLPPGVRPPGGGDPDDR